MKRILLLLLLALATPAVFAQTQHGIQLNWTQSASPNITFNSVYQSAVKGGPYTLIFTSTAPIVTYQALMTQANQGTTACFVVTATAQNSFESPYSNEVCGTFPVQTGAPSGLSEKQF